MPILARVDEIGFGSWAERAKAALDADLLALAVVRSYLSTDDVAFFVVADQLRDVVAGAHRDEVNAVVAQLVAMVLRFGSTAAGGLKELDEELAGMQRQAAEHLAMYRPSR